MTIEQQLAKLDELFGSYKAEWLNEKIFQFFAAPSYFNALKSPRPCVLMGGRGTGKTTVLRGLSYEGQYALNNYDIKEFDKNEFIGIYYRANTNHVRSFSGRGIDSSLWTKIFEHYFNLIFTSEVLDFVNWHRGLASDDDVLSDHACKLIATSLHLEEEVTDFKSLHENLELAMFDFQADVNNIADGKLPKLSMAGDPIKILCDQLRKLRQFHDKVFYLLIDEYENFLDEQQQAINGLLKHTPNSYTFKVGVREKGWRVKYTLNRQELLNDPAEYVLFNIVEFFTSPETERLFDEFARQVCCLRIKELLEGKDTAEEFHIDSALESITKDEESERLGVRSHEYYQKVVDYERDHGVDLGLPPLFKFFIGYWDEEQHESLDEQVRMLKENAAKMRERYENYKESMLFKIKKGQGNAIQKYYSGWETFIRLANGDIRYLMELVYRSYYLYLQEQGDITKPVPAEIQTKAAKNVGRKNLTELEGNWENGAQLTRMVQSFGTIFGRLAKDGNNIAPELTQFEIEGEEDGEITERTEKLLSAAVMNLALVRLTSNKLTGKGSVKEFMYMLHPIFAPYYNFSYRKKRKMAISEAEFLLCIDNQKEGVATVLKNKKVDVEKDKLHPEQLSLFDYWDE